MPTEDRRIIFTFDEAYKAIYSLSDKQGIRKPPPGEVTAVIKDPKDDSELVFTLHNPQDNEADRKIRYSRDFMAAALMLLCRGHGIPIPKSAKKSVVLGASNVILRVEM